MNVNTYIHTYIHNIWLTIGIFFGRMKIGLVFRLCGCSIIGMGLILVCNFPENGIT